MKLLLTDASTDLGLRVVKVLIFLVSEHTNANVRYMSQEGRNRMRVAPVSALDFIQCRFMWRQPAVYSGSLSVKGPDIPL